MSCPCKNVSYDGYCYGREGCEKMTYEEARDLIKEEAVPSFPPKIAFGRWHFAKDMAVDALEKQIPKKPIASKDWCAATGRSVYYSDPFQWFCPKCGSTIGVDGQKDGENHCCECGQALDWSGVE